VFGLVPGWSTLAVHFRPLQITAEVLEQRLRLRQRLREPLNTVPAAPRCVRIPVSFLPDHAVDLESVAAACGFLVEACIAELTGSALRVRLIGFSPGFPYLSGLPEVLHVPRRALLRGGWGGFEGRRLVSGDYLAVCELTSDKALPWLPSADKQAAWSIRLQSLPNDAPTILRFVAGTYWEQLTPDSRDAVLGQSFAIRPESDRMGYRLRGSELVLAGSEQGRLKSAAVVPGTLQLPADGQLLLLMADCAPTGGYPRIGHVISADLSLAGQLRPGDALRLVQVTHVEALEALRVQERALRAALVMARL
jgi:hypothetical protein